MQGDRGCFGYEIGRGEGAGFGRAAPTPVLPERSASPSAGLALRLARGRALDLSAPVSLVRQFGPLAGA